MTGTSHTWYSIMVPPMKNYRVCLNANTGKPLRVQVACSPIGGMLGRTKWRDLDIKGKAAARPIEIAQKQRTELWAENAT